MKSQNSELFERIHAFKKDASSKASRIKNLIAENQVLSRELEMKKNQIEILEVCN